MEKEVRLVHVPEHSVTGLKVVQLTLDEELILLFARAQPRQDFHYEMLRDFLQENDIMPGTMLSPRDGRTVLPALEGERYRVRGMGRVDIYGRPREFDFGGESTDYRIGLDREFTRCARAMLSKLDS